MCAREDLQMSLGFGEGGVELKVNVEVDSVERKTSVDFARQGERERVLIS